MKTTRRTMVPQISLTNALHEAVAALKLADEGMQGNTSKRRMFEHIAKAKTWLAAADKAAREALGMPPAEGEQA